MVVDIGVVVGEQDETVRALPTSDLHLSDHVLRAARQVVANARHQRDVPARDRRLRLHGSGEGVQVGCVVHRHQEIHPALTRPEHPVLLDGGAVAAMVAPHRGGKRQPRLLLAEAFVDTLHQAVDVAPLPVLVFALARAGDHGLGPVIHYAAAGFFELPARDGPVVEVVMRGVGVADVIQVQPVDVVLADQLHHHAVFLIQVARIARVEPIRLLALRIADKPVRGGHFGVVLLGRGAHVEVDAPGVEGQPVAVRCFNRLHQVVGGQLFRPSVHRQDFTGVDDVAAAADANEDSVKPRRLDLRHDGVPVLGGVDMEPDAPDFARARVSHPVGQLG